MNLIIYSMIMKDLSKNYRMSCLKNNALKVVFYRTLSVRSDFRSLKWWLQSCCWDKKKERSLTEVHLMNSSVCAGMLSAFSTRGSLGVLPWCAEASGDINTRLLALKPLLWVRVTRGNQLFSFDYWLLHGYLQKRNKHPEFLLMLTSLYDMRSFFSRIFFFYLCNYKSRWYWLINDVM